MKKISFYFFLIIVFVSACRKDIDNLSFEIEEEAPIVLIKSSIRGKVIDEFGLPISFASIQVNGNFTTSNIDGDFQFNKIEVKKSGGVIIADTDGYFKGVTQSNFSADGSSFVEIRMMEKGEADMVNPASEQIVNKTNGLKITIPENSIVSANGSIYNGMVNVYSRWIDPTDENLGGIMPGSLDAMDANGEEKVLATYGMLALELETLTGDRLEINSSSELMVELPIPADLLGNAPESIPLWEYDLEEGQWLESGVCNKNGNVYYCSIPSTGIWNCDVPLEAICLSGQVFNADSSYSSYLKVIIEDLTDNFIYWGYTDSTGFFCGSVPKAAPLQITIMDHCDNIIYTDDIGPYSSDFHLEDIYLDENISEYQLNIIGSINHCQNTSTPVGHLGVRYPGNLKVFPIFNNGSYDINLALKCTDFPIIELTAYSTFEHGSTVSTIVDTSDNVDLGIQNTCENLIDSFALTVDGISYFTSPTQYYLKPNQTTNWMVLEGLSGAGKFTLELRDYQGTGTYTVNTFFKTENASLLPAFDILEAASPDITVNVTLDDGVFIGGNYSGIAVDSNNTSRNISGDFKIKKAP